MRMMMKVTMQVEAGNELVRKGKLGSTVQAILAEIKPEAAYFVAEGGQRTGFIFLDVSDASHIPALAEPFFLAFNASVSITPAMVPEDLGKAAKSFERVAKKYGKR
ncbi:MAG: hypothetical protein ABI995_14315 [Acidobacteriota bacterium]